MRKASQPLSLSACEVTNLNSNEEQCTCQSQSQCYGFRSLSFYPSYLRVSPMFYSRFLFSCGTLFLDFFLFSFSTKLRGSLLSYLEIRVVHWDCLWHKTLNRKKYLCIWRVYFYITIFYVTIFFFLFSTNNLIISGENLFEEKIIILFCYSKKKLYRMEW